MRFCHVPPLQVGPIPARPTPGRLTRDPGLSLGVWSDAKAWLGRVEAGRGPGVAGGRTGSVALRPGAAAGWQDRVGGGAPLAAAGGGGREAGVG